MQTKKLGSSDLEVSIVCLVSLTSVGKHLGRGWGRASVNSCRC